MPGYFTDCPDCGQVYPALRVDEIKVRICDDNNEGEYSFVCNRCLMTIVKPAPFTTIDLLVASGVPFETWRLPAELFEKKKGGPPISHDDILNFHFDGEDGKLEEAAASLPPGKSG